jgi:hypothetical protein
VTVYIFVALHNYVAWVSFERARQTTSLFQQTCGQPDKTRKGQG